MEVFAGLLANDKDERKRFRLEDDKCGRIEIRRLGRQRGIRGFGNAWAVRNFLQDAKERQAMRLTELRRRQHSGLDRFKLEYVGLLGPVKRTLTTMTRSRSLGTCSDYHK